MAIQSIDEITSNSLVTSVEIAGSSAGRNQVFSDLPQTIDLPALTRVAVDLNVNTIDDIEASQQLIAAYNLNYIAIYVNGFFLPTFPPIARAKVVSTFKIATKPQPPTIITQSNGITVKQDSVTNGEEGVLVQGAVTASAPNYTQGHTSPLSLNKKGALRVIAEPGTADIGKIRFSLPDVDAMSELLVSANANGDNILIPGVATQTTRVYRVFFVLSDNSNLVFADSTPTNLTGPITMYAGGSFVLDLQGEPWFTTAAGEDFVLNQTGTAQISGRIYYTQS